MTSFFDLLPKACFYYGFMISLLINKSQHKKSILYMCGIYNLFLFSLTLIIINPPEDHSNILQRLRKTIKQTESDDEAKRAIFINSKKCFKRTVYKRTFEDNSTYKGDLQDGKRSGFGKHIYSDGSYYQGEYFNGKRHGYGQYRDGSGKNRYWGSYRNGYRQGRGTLKVVNKYTYEGQFREGKFHGSGTLTFPDKSYYQGLFKEGRWAEKGKYVDKNEKVFNLVFKSEERSEVMEMINDWMMLKEIKQFMPEFCSKKSKRIQEIAKKY